MFTEALFTVARIWKQPRCPLAEDWIRKHWCIYIMEYHYPTTKKDTFESVLTNMLTHTYRIEKDTNNNPIMEDKKRDTDVRTNFWIMREKARVG